MLIVHKLPRLFYHGQTVKMLNTTLRLRFEMRWNLFLFGLLEKLLKLRLGKVYLVGGEIVLFCWRVVYDLRTFFLLPRFLSQSLVLPFLLLLSHGMYLY